MLSACDKAPEPAGAGISGEPSDADSGPLDRNFEPTQIVRGRAIYVNPKNLS